MMAICICSEGCLCQTFGPAAVSKRQNFAIGQLCTASFESVTVRQAKHPVKDTSHSKDLQHQLLRNLRVQNISCWQQHLQTVCSSDIYKNCQDLGTTDGPRWLSKDYTTRQY